MIALATTTITVETATENEPGESRTWSLLAAGVRAQIGSPSGTEDTSPGGARTTLTTHLECDVVPGLTHLCRVTDEATGEVWEVQWVKQRALIPHMAAGLTRWQGGGR